jgi:hypothetical protein
MQRTNEAIALNRLEDVSLAAFGETPLAFGNSGEKFAEVAHDARNMVSALACFCDLLEAPGVLTEPYQHYGNELKLVASASRRLIDKLLTLDGASAVATNDTALNVMAVLCLNQRQRARPRQNSRTWLPNLLMTSHGNCR